MKIQVRYSIDLDGILKSNGSALMISVKVLDSTNTIYNCNHAFFENGYIVREGDNVTKHVDKYLPNPRPCGLESYITYPKDMNKLCDCPIWDYEDCARPSYDTLLYSAAMTDMNATKHSCISACTLQGKGQLDQYLETLTSAGVAIHVVMVPSIQVNTRHVYEKISGTSEDCNDLLNWNNIMDDDMCEVAAEYIESTTQDSIP